jgi:SAM-dependent methyltransferase
MASQRSWFDNPWFLLVVVLSILLFIVMYFGHRVMPEGFSQNERYTMNRGSNSYDDFYAGIYDLLYKSEERSEYESNQIILATQPDKLNSRFLDIGCGTGCLVDKIRALGYRAEGIDKSAAMIKAGKEKRVSCALRQGDAEDSMVFDRGSFTHILCMNGTIYAFRDKVAFFRNCSHWLQPGGYLIVHLVEPGKFDPIIPLGKGGFSANPSGKGGYTNPSTEIPSGKPRSPQEFSQSRITNSAIDFIDFKYKSAYDFNQLDKGVVVQIETFTDAASNHVRQNEHTLYMEKERVLLDQAQFAGFLVTGQFTMERYNSDPYQTVYILQKM